MVSFIFVFEADGASAARRGHRILKHMLVCSHDIPRADGEIDNDIA
jgi:hypothetical protein